MQLSNNQWKFKKLQEKEIKLGELCRNINNLIVNFPDLKGTEADADLIIDNIWLGNWKAAHDHNFFTNNNIEFVINATDTIPNKFPFINYSTFPIKDITACQQDMMEIIETGADIINKTVLENKPILVHCKRGHHRSASMVAFYLMKYHNMTLIEAVYVIKKYRPTAFRRMTCMLKTLIVYEHNKNY